MKKGRTGELTNTPVLPVSVLPDRQIITLLTDFGTNDYFVGSLKGVISAINPHVQIVDITHGIPPHDIAAGAFTLLACYRVFPPGTTHVAVVDPGVGSSRRPILVTASQQVFVGPDNGLFSYIYDAEPQHEVFELTNDLYFRHPVSATFHGRDIFAPIAAAVSTGVAVPEFGAPLIDAVRLPSIAMTTTNEGTFRGRILHVDHFGNCITNITPEFLSKEHEAHARITIKGKTIRSFQQFFGASRLNRGKLFGIWGSAGFLEIAAFEQSAARILKAKTGDVVTLKV